MFHLGQEKVQSEGRRNTVFKGGLCLDRDWLEGWIQMGWDGMDSDEERIKEVRMETRSEGWSW